MLATWSRGRSENSLLATVDILIINHGINVHGQCHPEAIQTSLDVNALSGWRLMEVFFSTCKSAPRQNTAREVWVNTSEAEVSPAFSPLYETSKRLMGELNYPPPTDSPLRN